MGFLIGTRAVDGISGGTYRGLHTCILLRVLIESSGLLHGMKHSYCLLLRVYNVSFCWSVRGGNHILRYRQRPSKKPGHARIKTEKYSGTLSIHQCPRKRQSICLYTVTAHRRDEGTISGNQVINHSFLRLSTHRSQFSACCS